MGPAAERSFRNVNRFVQNPANQTQRPEPGRFFVVRGNDRDERDRLGRTGSGVFKPSPAAETATSPREAVNFWKPDA